MAFYYVPQVRKSSLCNSSDNGGVCMKMQLRTHLSEDPRAALVPLWRAFACAEALKVDPWDFALRLTNLLDLGVNQSDLRWLVLHGYVTFRDRARRFQQGTKTVGSGDPRFMITAAGASVARPGTVGVDLSPGGCSGSAEVLSARTRFPRWNGNLRQLSFDGYIIKQFRLPASNQAAVLSAFEEEGWPPLIDDPLPFMPRRIAKDRLHATIRHLNANHQTRLIRFRGNGTGEAVLWELVAASAVDRPTATLSLRRAA
jgi:hypothetical protein